ncbi:hypothetical protein ONZ45_g16763 [Pleurotus djamor]|nr:hypothetical protein ONZ45_g16763 [Pleurotus djamor]
MSVLSAGPELAVLTLVPPPTTKKLNLILGEYGSDLTFLNGTASYQATLGSALIAASRAESSSRIFVSVSLGSSIVETSYGITPMLKNDLDGWVAARSRREWFNIDRGWKPASVVEKRRTSAIAGTIVVGEHLAD